MLSSRVYQRKRLQTSMVTGEKRAGPTLKGNGRGRPVTGLLMERGVLGVGITQKKKMQGFLEKQPRNALHPSRKEKKGKEDGKSGKKHRL